MSPSSRTRTRTNSFDALRLVAASTVIAGHAIPLSGRGDPPQIAGIPFFDLAVYVFFAISGYLIATSWRRRPEVRTFLARRAVRIFPALFVVVIVTTFVVGPLATARSIDAYFASPQTWGYLRSLFLLAEYRLPGVFEQNPITIVNGSLWTIGPEFVCYLIVMCLGVLARWRGGRLLRISAYLGIAIVLGCLAALPAAALDAARAVTTAMVFFFASALLSEILEGRPRLPLLVTAAVAVGWLVASSLIPGSIVPIGWVALPLAVIAVGEREIPLLRRAGRFGDPSYGMYLWGFLIQQVLVALAPPTDLIVNTVIVLAISGTVGLLSWHLLEAPSMALVRGRQRDSVVGAP